MAAALLSPVHSSRALPSDKMSHSEEMERLAPGMLSSRSSSYRSANSNLNNNSPRGTSPPGSGGSMATLAAEGTLTDRQRSGSRVSERQYRITGWYI